MLQTFDRLWAEYEQKYVYELMVIESDARRFIIDSINCEAVLSQPHMQQAIARNAYNEKRRALLQNICQVNAVVTSEDGKGRDDFRFETLIQAEEIIAEKNSDKKSKSSS